MRKLNWLFGLLLAIQPVCFGSVSISSGGGTGGSVEGTAVLSTAESSGLVLTANGSGGASWTSVAGTGDVVGPASATDNHFVTFNGATGKSVQDNGAGASLSDLGVGTFTEVIDSGLTASTAIYSNGSKQLTSLAAGTNGDVMVQAAGIPSWAAQSTLAAGTAAALASNPSDCASDTWATTIAANGNLTCSTITVAGGGTGIASYTAGDILYASGATTLSKLAKGTASQLLRMNAGATAPEWATISSGIGGTTGATDNAVLRADGTGGSTIQSSSMTLTDSGYLNGPAGLVSTPTYAGSGTASDSGLYFDGTIPTIARDGLVGGFFSSTSFGLSLASGAPQYLFNCASNVCTFWGSASTTLKIDSKIGATTEANSPLYARSNGGIFYVSTTATGNVGSGEDDLQTKSLPARTLYINATSANSTAAIKMEAWGTLAAAGGGTTSRIKAYIGTQQVGDCFDSTLKSATWHLEVTFQQDASDTAQQYISRCTIDDGSTPVTRLYRGTSTEDMGLAKTAKLTAQSSGGTPADNDIVSEVFKMTYVPQGT